MARKTKLTRYKAPQSVAERISEARASIARLEATMNQGNNRYGTYGDNCRASIKGWQDLIARLSNT